uniref:Metabotropic glutamate receptor 1 n=1 Tax=Lygus hesperus TaxID=30085 RepID=A0A0A9ZG75_LYGHE
MEVPWAPARYEGRFMRGTLFERTSHKSIYTVHNFRLTIKTSPLEESRSCSVALADWALGDRTMHHHLAPGKITTGTYLHGEISGEFSTKYRADHPSNSNTSKQHKTKQSKIVLNPSFLIMYTVVVRNVKNTALNMK